MEKDKNDELREILRKRKAQKESSINTNSNLQENSNATVKQDRIYFKNEFEKRAYKATKQAEFKLKQSQIEKEQYRQVLETKEQNNPNFRDYDENPLVINCYDEIFRLVLYIFDFVLAILLFAYFCRIIGIGGSWSQSEKTLFDILTCIAVGYVMIVCLAHDKYFYNYKIKFTNNHIYFIHNGKIKKSCPVVKDEIIRPFFVCADGKIKSGLVFKIHNYIALILISIMTFGFVHLANILIKLFVYFYINKNLKGFRFFPFIRVCSQTLMFDIYGAHLIYFYNDKVYLEIKKYFLQNNIDIDELPKTYLGI